MEEKNTKITEEQRKRNIQESKKWAKEHPIENTILDLSLKIMSIEFSVPKKQDIEYISKQLKKLKVTDFSDKLMSLLGVMPNEYIIKLFLKKGLSPNKTFFTKTDKEKYKTNLFSMACMHAKSPNVIKILIEHGAVINQYEDLYCNSPLINACMNIHNDINNTYEIVNMLLDNGAQVNYSNIHGRNPLNISLNLHSSPKVIKRLLEAGADINQKDSFGSTATDYAARYAPTTEIIDALIEHGADFKKDSNVLAQAYNNSNDTVKQYVIEKAFGITPEMRERAKAAREKQEQIEKENGKFVSWIGFAAPVFTIVDGLALGLVFISIIGLSFLSLLYGGLTTSVTTPLLNYIETTKSIKPEWKRTTKYLISGILIIVECYILHLFLCHISKR